MKSLLAALAVLLSAFTASCAEQTPPIDVSGLSEASMNFDQAGVGPFLTDLSTSFSSGFDSPTVDQLTSAIDSLPVEQTGNWEYMVTVDGKSERLVIVAFKDDTDAPDLSFYTSPALAADIQQRLQSFAAAQGW